MGRLFGFTSLEELIGTLLPSEEGVRFGRTQPAREWKEAVLSVASRDWLTRLQQLSIDDFKARIEDLKTRVGRDKEKIRIPAFDISFALFAQQLFGMQTPPANADPEQLGITYGRILVDVCAGATSQALNIHELLEARPYLDSSERDRIFLRCKHAHEHLEGYKKGGSCPDVLVEHLPSALTLLGRVQSASPSSGFSLL
ncbi:hypothetical protein JCM10049v2_006736 [Rhodotorula toruloides]